MGYKDVGNISDLWVGLACGPCPFQPVIDSIIFLRPWKIVLSVCICFISLCPLLVIGLLFLGFTIINFDH
jgi:hypothetical protein